MLVLSFRRHGDRIFIGDDVCITLVPSNDRRRIRIGIDAPREKIVTRGDLLPDYEQEVRLSKIHTKK